MNSGQEIKEDNQDNINANVLTSESRINESSTLDYELLKAVIKGNVDKVKSLLEKGANPNIKGKNGRTAFLWAMILYNTEIVRKLLKNGANVSFKLDPIILRRSAEINKILIAYAIFQKKELSINILNYLDNASQDDINDIVYEFKNILERLERDDILFYNPWKLEKYITNNRNISTPLGKRLVEELKLPPTYKIFILFIYNGIN